ncbi:tetraacyldisaccharide 4'-kinase [Ramlibacter algicola]|uniref:Tetraacyldisaccharide 4'-kinase n=1 Tax=Ramlibacter algicola TaxID=2795217 RepID=A0A934Q2N5_9BURK|nr:tetraacyldisaccharide 4'-kinase [Ramlibacter algicola]
MAAALQRAWLHRGAVAVLLLPLALLYRLLASFHRSLFQWGVRTAWRAPVPVVIVGNVVAGGAGKTPVVIAIARHLRKRGISSGVVSRGHGRDGDAVLEVTPDTDPRRSGDEPLLIARSAAVPVTVAARRQEAVQLLLRRHPDVRVVLGDDGLQHHALARDLEIVVFDDRGIGNGWPLPAGPLREPWPRPADLVLRTEGARGIEGFTVRRQLAGTALGSDGRTIDLQSLRTRRCIAVAGIAQPQVFFDMLRARGVGLAATVALPDHDRFDSLPAGLDDRDAIVLCTEKDAAKLWKLRPDALAVPLEVDIDPAFWRALDAWLDARLSSTHGSQAA